MQIVAAVVFILVALLAVGMALRMRRAAERDRAEAEAALAWPTVSGQIIKSDVGSKRVRSGSQGQTSSTVFIPVVEYTYTVDAQPYTGNRIRVYAAESFSRKEGVQPVLEKYPVGAPVAVAYDPAQPDRAVLEPGGGGSLWDSVILPAILVLLGVAMAAGAIYALVA